MNKYGERLKELREKYGYTQDELAKKLGTSRSRIANYEQGTRQPDFEMQETLADLFNVSLDYLFGRNESQDTIETQYDKDTIEQALNLYNRVNRLSPDKQVAFLNLLDTLQDDT